MLDLEARLKILSQITYSSGSTGGGPGDFTWPRMEALMPVGTCAQLETGTNKDLAKCQRLSF